MKNVAFALCRASISNARSVSGSTREGSMAHCSIPTVDWTSVGWKYSSMSIVRTLSMLLELSTPFQRQHSEVEQAGEDSQDDTVGNPRNHGAIAPRHSKYRASTTGMRHIAVIRRFTQKMVNPNQMVLFPSIGIL
jgi:hypothetical protein